MWGKLFLLPKTKHFGKLIQLPIDSQKYSIVLGIISRGTWFHLAKTKCSGTDFERLLSALKLQVILNLKVMCLKVIQTLTVLFDHISSLYLLLCCILFSQPFSPSQCVSRPNIITSLDHISILHVLSFLDLGAIHLYYEIPNFHTTDWMIPWVWARGLMSQFHNILPQVIMLYMDGPLLQKLTNVVSNLNTISSRNIEAIQLFKNYYFSNSSLFVFCSEAYTVFVVVWLLSPDQGHHATEIILYLPAFYSIQQTFICFSGPTAWGGGCIAV